VHAVYVTIIILIFGGAIAGLASAYYHWWREEFQRHMNANRGADRLNQEVDKYFSR